MNRKWLDDLPYILTALHLTFPINEIWTVPCAITEHSKQIIRQFWLELPSSQLHYQGRRLSIQKETEMFHPAFLPQLACELLPRLPLEGKPIVWQGGFAFRLIGDTFGGFYMHGGYIPEKFKERMENRRHGEPERLQVLDFFVKGTSQNDVEALFEMIHRALDRVFQFYWGTSGWNTSILFPSTIKNYFSIKLKRLIFALPLPPSSPLINAHWEEIEKELLHSHFFSPAVLKLNGYSKLHFACHEGRLDILQKLPNAVFEAGKRIQTLPSPIFLACQNGQTEILEFLIALGTELDLAETWIAEEENQQEVINLLITFWKNPLSLRTSLVQKLKLGGQKISVAQNIFEQPKTNK